MVVLARTGILCTLLGVYWFILLARVILSYFPRLPEGIRPLADIVYKLTEPVIRLARPLIPPLRIGMVALDLSIILVFFIIGLLQRVACTRGL